MILSHKHRFVFIKGVKVAGTSAEIALSQICGPDDVVTPITPADERFRLGTAGEARNYTADRESERAYRGAVADTPADELVGVRAPRGAFYNHMPLTEVLALVPEARGYRLLFVERSPYAKVISYANWDANQQAYKSGRPLPNGGDGLAEAIQRTIDDGSFLKVRNIDRYRDESGGIPTDGWRFETLAEQLKTFFERCGENPLPLPHAKHGVASETLDVAAALSPLQVEIIDQHFAAEFDTFGYARLGTRDEESRPFTGDKHVRP